MLKQPKINKGIIERISNKHLDPQKEKENKTKERKKKKQNKKQNKTKTKHFLTLACNTSCVNVSV